jgi:hypothetical protein
VITMGWLTAWTSRAWLPYLLAGALWVTVGAVVPGYPAGLGLIFVGLCCLAAGTYGAGRKRRVPPRDEPAR